MKILHNAHINNDEYPYGASYLILDTTSCWRVNKTTRDVISYLSGKGSKDQYIEELRALGCKDPEKMIEDMLRKGILRNAESLHVRIWSFLKNPVVPLLKGNWISKICSNNLLHILFSPILATIICLSFIGVVVCLYLVPFLMHKTNPSAWNNISLVWIGLGALAHELGHSCAAAYCGIGYRSIGLTWYLIWPVAFTNVSGIELLNKSQRMIINLGGIYFQSGIVVLLFIINLLWPASGAGGAIKALNCLLIINLNPFIRSDAYWCFQDGVVADPKAAIQKVLNVLYQIGYAAFTISIVYYVGKEGILSFIKIYNGWNGLGQISLKNVIYFMILSYMQLLIIKGMYFRIIGILKNLKLIRGNTIPASESLV